MSQQFYTLLRPISHITSSPLSHSPNLRFHIYHHSLVHFAWLSAKDSRTPWTVTLQSLRSHSSHTHCTAFGFWVLLLCTALIRQLSVYQQQPEGYDDGSGRVCLLVKTLYGLKQSGQEWNKELDEKLKEFGFHPLRSDPCTYVRRDGKNLEIITVLVDDRLLFTTSNDLMKKMKDEISSKWTVMDMGEPAKISGIEVTQNDNSIQISQLKPFLKEREWWMQIQFQCQGIWMTKFNRIQMVNEGSKSNSYAKLLGELQFLTNAMRPDIAYAVNWLSAYTANPSLQCLQHVGATKRILRYLKGTKSLAIKYLAQSDEELQENKNLLHRYADAAYANMNDYKSTSGYVFIVGGGAITWRLKKQTTVALSSTEAEYVALLEAGHQACWLRSLYDKIGYTQESPILIKGDNDSSVTMARNPQLHKCSIHIRILWHWVRDLVQENIKTIESCQHQQKTFLLFTSFSSASRSSL